MSSAPKFIRWFGEIGSKDVASVGGKNASLGEMVSRLASAEVKVPNGFAITAEGYRYMLDQADAWPALHRALDGLDARDVDDLARRGHTVPGQLLLGQREFGGFIAADTGHCRAVPGSAP